MHFFATSADMMSVITSIENTWQLDYYEAGLFDSSTAVLHHSLLAISTLALPTPNSGVHCTRYLVLDSPSDLQIRTIPQKCGSPKYAIDQLVNPESLIIQLGGIHQDGMLIVSSIGTAHKSTFSTSLLSAYRRCFKKQFQVINGIFVGREAHMFLNTGWHLVFDVTQPREYDLQKQGPHNL